MSKEHRGRYESASWTPSFERPGRKGRAGRYRAFVPDPIGDYEPPLRSATSALSERAGLAVRELNSSARDLLPLEGLGRQLLRSEALASSAIEGLEISHRKLSRAEVWGREGDFKAHQVLGNAQAMEKAIQIGSEAQALDAESICSIHRELAIAPPLNRIAGKVRDSQGWIGGSSPVHAAFVPPAAEHLPGLIDDLCEFMNRDDISPVAQAAIAHAQFETIHPFGDGNGRVGRCLIHVLLKRRGVAPSYVPPVSIVLGADKDSYIAGLEEFRADEVDPWVARFAVAVEESALWARGFSASVAELQAAWIERAEPMRADATARMIVEWLPSYPIITGAIAERLTGRSRVAVNRGLDHLAQAGILARHRNQRRGDSWEARELLALVEEFEEMARRGSHI